MGSEQISTRVKSNNINIISNERITNFSEYLKAANLTSKKDILFKGLSNNTPLNNKLITSRLGNKVIENKISSNNSSSEKKQHVSNKINARSNNILKNSNCSIKSKETISETESSTDDEGTETKSFLEPVADIIEEIPKADNVSDTESSDNESNINYKTKPTTTSHNHIINSTTGDSKAEESNQTILTQFQSVHKLKVLQSEAIHLINDLEDSDLYLMQIPKSINSEFLINKEVQIGTECETKIKSDEGNYLIQVEDIKQESSLLLSQTKNKEYNVNILNGIRGIISVHQTLKSKKKSNSFMDNMEEDLVLYPNNLKARHPIFGSDYEDKINLDKEVQRKLTKSINKAKKRKRLSTETYEDKELITEMFNANSSSISKKKKKKSKDMESGEDFEQLLNKSTILLDFKDRTSDEISLFTNSTSHKKKKKSKESSIVNSTMINNHTAYFESDLSQIPISTDDKKKKHKSKKGKNRHLLNITETDSLDLLDIKQKKKKKKKKHEDL